MSRDSTAHSSPTPSQWKLTRLLSQILLRYEKVVSDGIEAEQLMQIHLQDLSKRSIFLEISADLIFVIASFLDVTTIAMGMAFLSRKMLFVLGENNYPPPEFSNPRFVYFQPRHDALPAITDNAGSSEIVSPDAIAYKKAQFNGSILFTEQRERLKQSILFFRSQLLPKNLNCHQLLNLRFEITSISANAENIVIGSEEGDLEIFDRNGNRLHQLNWGDTSIGATAISPDRQILAVGSYKIREVAHAIRLIDISSGKVVRQIEGLTTSAKKIVFNHDGSLIAVHQWNGKFFVINAITLKRMPIDIQVIFDSTISFSSNGKLLACFDGLSHGDHIYKTVKVFNTENWKLCLEVEIQRMVRDITVRRISFSPNGKFIAFGNDHESNHSVIVWDLHQRKCVGRLDGFGHQIQDVEFSSDNKKLITVLFDSYTEHHRHASNHGTIIIWDFLDPAKKCEVKRISRDRFISACNIHNDHIFIGHTDGVLTHYGLLPMVKKLEQPAENTVSACP